MNIGNSTLTNTGINLSAFINDTPPTFIGEDGYIYFDGEKGAKDLIKLD